MGRLLMASNRLPVSIITQGNGLALDRSIGGVATALDAIFKRYEATWVGWTGLRYVLSDDQLRALRFPKRLLPVQADAPLVESYYDQMTNRVLWPTFHDIAAHYRPKESDWEALREIGRRFAEVIKQNIGPDDMLWIHDYHLIFVPTFLRQMGVKNRLGYFWHTPFPTPKYFQKLAHCKEIMESMGVADLVGMQTERDVTNFHNSVAETGTVALPKRVQAFPIGIDFSAYYFAVHRPAVRALGEEIKKDYADKRMILSISRLDYTKGIPNQLRAVARFLERKPPEEREAFIYKLVVAPSREDVPEYHELKKEIEMLVTEINKKLSTKTWKPVEYAYQNFGFADMTAWYRSAEVLLLLPVKDGMNLIAKEFVATRKGRHSVLILSNTTGSAAQLQDALLINPNDDEAGAKALQQAFTMPHNERETRWKRMLEVVRDQDVFWWADRFIQALKDID